MAGMVAALSPEDMRNLAAYFSQQKLKPAEAKDEKLVATEEANGTRVVFEPDESIFRNFQYRDQHIERLLWNYCYLNTGLSIFYNGERYQSKNGLVTTIAIRPAASNDNPANGGASNAPKPSNCGRTPEM